MPAVRLCNYSPLSLACLYSLSSSSFSLPSSLPLFFYIPLFALFLLICANHHETTATLEPLTGTAWHPAPSKRIIAGAHTHFQVLCASSSSVNSQLRRFGIYYGERVRGGGDFSSLQNCHVSLWLLINSKDVDCFEQDRELRRRQINGSSSPAEKPPPKKTGIKAEEFTRNMVGLMFIWWNIIVTFLLHYSTGVELRIRPRFVLD